MKHLDVLRNDLSPARRQADIWTMMSYCHLGHWHFAWNSHFSADENAFENAACKMSAFSSSMLKSETLYVFVLPFELLGTSTLCCPSPVMWWLLLRMAPNTIYSIRYAEGIGVYYVGVISSVKQSHDTPMPIEYSKRLVAPNGTNDMNPGRLCYKHYL